MNLIFPNYLSSNVQKALEEQSNMKVDKPKILCHIAGPSGCGKTTLMNTLKEKYPKFEYKDLDDFDDGAMKYVPSSFRNLPRSVWSNEVFDNMFNKKQELFDKFINRSSKPVVIVGIHNEWFRELDFKTPNKFLLNIDAETAAIRAINRAKKGNQTHSNHDNNTKDSVDMWNRRNQAQQDILWLCRHGYIKKHVSEIEQFLKECSE